MFGSPASMRRSFSSPPQRLKRQIDESEIGNDKQSLVSASARRLERLLSFEGPTTSQPAELNLHPLTSNLRRRSALDGEPKHSAYFARSKSSVWYKPSSNRLSERRKSNGAS
eukprot:scaffold481740_cov46-Prasinocladus_malaysianus.AAC.1